MQILHEKVLSSFYYDKNDKNFFDIVIVPKSHAYFVLYYDLPKKLSNPILLFHFFFLENFCLENCVIESTSKMKYSNMEVLIFDTCIQKKSYKVLT